MDAMLKKLQKLIHTNLRDEPALLEEFDTILKSLNTINEQRNTYIHSLWTYSGFWEKDPGIDRRKFLRAFNPKKGLEDIERTNATDIDKFTNEVIATREKLTRFFIDNHKAIHEAIDRRKLEELIRQTPEPI